MIVVKVELHSAITKKVTEIGRLCIYNKGKAGGSTPTRGNYRALLMRRGSAGTGWLNHGLPQRTGDVDGHARLSAPVWALVKKALNAVGF